MSFRPLPSSDSAAERAANLIAAVERSAARGEPLPVGSVPRPYTSAVRDPYWASPVVMAPPVFSAAAFEAAKAALSDGDPAMVTAAMVLTLRALTDHLMEALQFHVNATQQWDLMTSWAFHFIRADLANLAQQAKASGWGDGTPVGPERFGELWDDATLATWDILELAGARLRKLMAGHDSGRAELAWSTRIDGGLPTGVVATIAAPEWDLQVSRGLAWHEVANAHTLAGSLFGLWYELLDDRFWAIRAEAAVSRGG